jgi:hypothetical protein
MADQVHAHASRRRPAAMPAVSCSTMAPRQAGTTPPASAGSTKAARIWAGVRHHTLTRQPLS